MNNKSTQRRQLERKLAKVNDRSKKPREATQLNGKSANGSAAHESEKSEAVMDGSHDDTSAPFSMMRLLSTAAVLGSVFLWAYWPTILDLIQAWNSEADYSHGYLVVPFALYFLWARRDSFPGVSAGVRWPGLLLIAASIGIRYAATLVYASSVDAWSILLYAAGVAWLLGGWRVMWWSLPSIAFLWFMMPLPYRVERWLSLPLQGVATQLSCWTLQCLGQPAIAEGHTILLGENQMEIEQACSGLRIFMGIVALAFVYLVLIRRTWWEKLLLAASTVPVALVANATRIVLTGLLFQYTTGEIAHKFSHDFAGWLMIPFAAFLFALVLWYLGKLFREVEPTDVRSVIRREVVT
jgi:exosortase